MSMQKRQAFLVMMEHSDFLALRSGPRKDNPETFKDNGHITLLYQLSKIAEKVYFTGGNSIRSSSVCIYMSTCNHRCHGELYSCDICSNLDD